VSGDPARHPRPVRVPDSSATPSLDRTVVLGDGRTVAYAEWGDPDGRPVFLLHGMPGSRLFCPDVAATVAAGVRLITPDRPGYGRSEPRPGRAIIDGADELEEVATRLGIDRFGVVGWSSGGPYALASAMAARDRVAAVAVVAGDAPIAERPELTADLPAEAQDRIAGVRRGDNAALERLEARLTAAAEALLQRFGDGDGDRGDSDVGSGDSDSDVGSEADAADPDATYRALAAYRAALATMFREAFRQGTSGFRDDWIATIRPWGFRLADVDRPVDVWWGDADQLTDRRHTLALAAGIRSARLTIVEGAGHSVLAAEWPAILGNLLGQWPAARSRR
jgi:pimeloyl-ACP methyl ester carboxylesterase